MPKLFYTEVSGTRDRYTADDLEQQLRNLVVATMANTLGGADVPFVDMAANQGVLSARMQDALNPVFARYGVALDSFAVESVSLPEELQKSIDARISMGMVGDLQKFTQYQVASSVPLAAANEGGLAGVGAGIAAGVSMGQLMADAMRSAMPTQAAPAAAADDPARRLEQLKTMLDKALITQAEYDTAKAEILRKLVG